MSVPFFSSSYSYAVTTETLTLTGGDASAFYGHVTDF